MPALAITDYGVMYGAIDLYKEAKKQGIKPIIGCEVYVAQRRSVDDNIKCTKNANEKCATKNRQYKQKI